MHFMINNNISSSMLSSDKDYNGVVGVKNVQRQLELHYPESHQLNIEKSAQGFLINLYIQLDNQPLPQNS